MKCETRSVSFKGDKMGSPGKSSEDITRTIVSPAILNIELASWQMPFFSLWSADPWQNRDLL